MKIRALKTILIYTLFNINFLYAQNVIHGRVVDNNSKPLAFTNIGIPNAGIGTISNDDGTFQLKVASSNINDSLLISLVGYISKKMYIRDAINKNVEINLSASIQMLQPVIVTLKHGDPKSYILGNPNAHGGIVGVDTVYSGAAYALLIDNKELKNNKPIPIPLYLDAVRININNNNTGKFKLRVSICGLDSITALPDEDNLKTSLVKEWDVKNGFVDYDLTTYQLLIDRPFFIIAELIQTGSDRKKVANSINEYKKTNANKIKEDSTEIDGKRMHLTKLPSQNLPIAMLGMDNRKFATEHYICCARSVSFGKWERIPIILTATAILSK